MGFLKKIGESVKKTGKTIVKEVKATSETIRTKKRILNKFEMKDLKKLCKAYGIGKPSSYQEDLMTGERRKIRLTRKDYINYIMFRLGLNQIEDYCNRHRIDIRNIEREKERKIKKIKKPKEEITERKIKRKPEFDDILNIIKNDFQDLILSTKFINESEFRKQLAMFLKMNFKNKKIEEECRSSRGRLDILIDRKYVLELKYADNKGTLDKGISEVTRYREKFDCIAVVILDTNKLRFSTIREYESYYEKLGAQVIILRGRGSRKKRRKSTKITIEQ